MGISYQTLCVIQCSICNHKWYMSYFEYMYCFIIKKCPRCGHLDTQNALKPENVKPKKYDNRTGIFLKEIIY